MFGEWSNRPVGRNVRSLLSAILLLNSDVLPTLNGADIQDLQKCSMSKKLRVNEVDGVVTHVAERLRVSVMLDLGMTTDATLNAHVSQVWIKIKHCTMQNSDLIGPEHSGERASEMEAWLVE